MGTIYPLPYVNIFMVKFETKYIYQLMKQTSILYLRYNDDIFNTLDQQLI